MRLSRLSALVISGTLITSCAPPQQTENPSSPVQQVARTQDGLVGSGDGSYLKQNDNGTRSARVLAPGPAVWDALVSAMNDRKVNLTVLDRGAGRLGDTAMVATRRWNGKPLSTYFSCGQNMTGERADQDRLRAVLVAQMSRLKGDTIGISVFFSAFATPMASGGSGSTTACTSTGKGEGELLDDVIRRAGGSGARG